MKCLAVTLSAVLLSAGCTSADLDPIMGRGTPVETQRLDCDLIFPGPASLPDAVVDGR